MGWNPFHDASKWVADTANWFSHTDFGAGLLRAGRNIDKNLLQPIYGEGPKPSDMPLSPGPPPDLSDLQGDKFDPLFLALSKRGRKASFVTGPEGLSSPAPISTPSLLGR